ncbi:MAG: hypothetical protein ACK5ML_07790 [Lachnospiraceae bacterium]
MKKISWIFGSIIFLFAVLLVPEEVMAASSMAVYEIALGSDADEGGDATLIESNGRYLLMDLGTEESYPYIKQFLKNKGVTTLSLYYSHFHGDHTGGIGVGGGLDQLLSDFNVDKIYLPSSSFASSAYYSSYYTKINTMYQSHYPKANLNTQIIQLSRGMAFSVGGATVQIIGPVGMENYSVSDMDGYDSAARQKTAFINNYSLVARISAGGTVFLTAGDIEQFQEKLLIQAYKNSGMLDADIFKMNHHGHYMSNTPEFLECVTPDQIFASNNGNAAGQSTADKTQRVVAKSLYYASQQGMCYLVGDERQSIGYVVNGSQILVYKTNGNLAADGEQLTGYVRVKGGDGRYETYDHYLLDSNGRPIKGVQTVNGKIRYFGTGGCMDYGSYSPSGVYNPWRYYTEESAIKVRFFLESDYSMKTGWMDYGGNFYYLDPATGYRATGITKIGSSVYYFSNSGIRQSSQWVTENGKTYYLGSDGVAMTGWKKVDNTKYYFDKSTGAKALGLTKTGSVYRYFYKDGTYAKNTTISVDGTKLIFGSDGKLVNVPKPASVTIKKVTASANKLRVYWTRNKKADYYKIYISTKKNSGYKLAAVVDGGAATKQSIYGLTNGTSYYVKVKAYDVIDGLTFKSSNSNIVKKKVDYPSPSTVTVKKVKTTATGQIRVYWTQTTNTEYYKVYVSTKKSSGYKSYAVVNGSDITKTNIGGLKSGKTYYVKVRAYRVVNGVVYKSKNSNIIEIKVK